MSIKSCPEAAPMICFFVIILRTFVGILSSSFFLGGGCHDWHVFSLELNHCHDMILEAELLAMTRYSLCSVALEP
jgi:hypothetical protein